MAAEFNCHPRRNAASFAQFALALRRLVFRLPDRNHTHMTASWCCAIALWCCARIPAHVAVRVSLRTLLAMSALRAFSVFVAAVSALVCRPSSVSSLHRS